MWKPMLAPNQELDLNNIKYAILASTKLDGYRCIFYKGKMVTRSLKPIQNKQLREKFETFRKYTEEHNLIIDGEIYSHEISFQELNKFFMSEDFESEKSIKRYGKVLNIPNHVKFYAFDCITNGNLEEEFFKRCLKLHKITDKFKDITEYVIQTDIFKKEDIETLFEKVLKDGYEGLILKDPNGRYKCGRGTIKEGLIYKVKPFKSIEARVVNIVQATKVNPNVEKKINELGRSETSRKKNDRLFIKKASAVTVYYKEKLLKVTLAMTDFEKEKIWKNRDQYVGKWIEYKYLTIGMKYGGLPRHPTSLRWRNDKE